MEFVLALILPFIMMLFFTKVSYSKVGALIVTLMILIFAFNGLERSVVVIVVAVISVVTGYIGSMKIEKGNRGV